MSNWITKKKNRLYQADPNCSICGVQTVLTKDLMKKYNCTDCQVRKRAPGEEYNRQATVDHLYSKRNQFRKWGKPTPIRLVCHRCNQRLNELENKIYSHNPPREKKGPSIINYKNWISGTWTLEQILEQEDNDTAKLSG